MVLEIAVDRLARGQREIPGLDEALPGMEEGESKTVNVAAADAYGQPDANARQAVPRASIPADIPLEIGTRLQVQTPQGHVMPVTVVELDEEKVVLDANHPLAGKDLTFEIKLVSFDEGETGASDTQ